MNVAELQHRGSAALVNLPQFLKSGRYTHAFYMDPHPACSMMKHEKCVSLGDGEVADVDATREKFTDQCELRAAIDAHFDWWMRIIAWAPRREIQNTVCPHLNGALPALHTLPLVSNALCASNECIPRLGHQCLMGALTGISHSMLKHVRQSRGVKREEEDRRGEGRLFGSL